MNIAKGRICNSFDVYECPLFELMTEIKQGLIKNAVKLRTAKAEVEESFDTVINLRFVEGKTVKEIADLTGYNERTIYKMLRKYKELKR